MSDLTDLHTLLQPGAKAAYSEIILRQTPPAMQSGMAALVATDLSGPLTPDPTKAMVSHAQNIIVHDNGGGTNAKAPGVANVTLSTLNFATLAA